MSELPKPIRRPRKTKEQKIQETNEQKLQELIELEKKIIEKPIRKTRQQIQEAIEEFDETKVSFNEQPKPKPINLIKADEWYLLGQLNQEILKHTLEILYEETLKFESGSAGYPSVELCISIAFDREKSEQSDKKIKEDILQKELEISLEDRQKIKEKFLKRFEGL